MTSVLIAAAVRHYEIIHRSGHSGHHRAVETTQGIDAAAIGGFDGAF